VAALKEMAQGIAMTSPGLGATAPQVGARATSGALWTLIFSISSKLVTLGGQVALAWFLLPGDFGLAAMVLSFTSVAGIMGGSYLKNILIQRSDRFDQEAGQVFWLSLAMYLLAAVVMSSLSPVAAHFFNEPRVIPLILIVALTAPVHALPVIYTAALNRNLRFRPLAAIAFGAVVVQNATAVWLAWLGCGAYSLIVSTTLMTGWMAVASRIGAGGISIGRPQPCCWAALYAPVGWLMFNSLFLALQASGANLIIGLLHKDATMAGYYYWGFTIASQAVFLLVTNLQGVLFPVLSKLNAEMDRQYEAVRRAGQTLMTVMVPACVLQALLAEPVIRLIFHDRWTPSIPVIQWLSVGLLTQAMHTLASSVLLARGAFAQLTVCNALLAVTVTGAALIGASSGGQLEIARCTGTSLLLMNLVTGWIAYRQLGQGWKDLFSTVAMPLLAGFSAAAAGALVAVLFRDAPMAVSLTFVLGTTLGTYLLVAGRLVRRVAKDITLRLGFDPEKTLLIRQS